MGTWGNGLKSNDIFMDIYDEFFDLYNKGGEPSEISRRIIDKNQSVLKIEEDKHNLWFALALAQWETKSLTPDVLSEVEDIIVSKANLEVWANLDAGKQDVRKRAAALEKFLEKIKTERTKAKPRKKQKLQVPIFLTGDCLVFKMESGNYGGAVVLAACGGSEVACNLVATTRINQTEKPTIEDFEKSEILILNFSNWDDRAHVLWCFPDLYAKQYARIYEVVGKISVEQSYDSNNHGGKGYLFQPSYTSAWDMNVMAEKQFKSELTKEKPKKKITVAQVCRKKKWWGII